MTDWNVRCHVNFHLSAFGALGKATWCPIQVTGKLPDENGKKKKCNPLSFCSCPLPHQTPAPHLPSVSHPMTHGTCKWVTEIPAGSMVGQDQVYFLSGGASHTHSLRCAPASLGKRDTSELLSACSSSLFPIERHPYTHPPGWRQLELPVVEQLLWVVDCFSNTVNTSWSPPHLGRVWRQGLHVSCCNAERSHRPSQADEFWQNGS